MLRKIAILLFLYHAVGTCASQAGTKSMTVQCHENTRMVGGARVVICRSR